MDLSAWWDGKEILEKGFWIIAIPSTTFFLITVVMSFFGGDMDDMDADGGDIDDVGDDGGIGFQFFTLKNLVAFFSIFSWTGISCSQNGYGTGASITISFGAGLLMMVIMAALFYFISKLSNSGTMKISNAIGVVGDVYLPIGAKRSGTGKIQITIQNALRTLDAISDDDEELPVGSIVKVTQIVNNQILLVTKSSN